MSEQKEMTKPPNRSPRETEPSLQPAVDIFETRDGITLRADMPGVDKEGLNIEVDKDRLLIEGDLSIDMPKEMEPLYAGVRATHYSRTFSLSSELDAGGIQASLKDGVLNVHIPKREELKPRKVEVRVG